MVGVSASPTPPRVGISMSMSERLSKRWFAPPRPRLAYDNDVIPARAGERPAAASPANHSSYCDQDLIDRLAADLQIDPATVSRARATGTAAQDNGDRAFVESLVAELNDARARIDQLEAEAEERLHQARMQIRAEIGAALGRLQDEADANLEAVKQEAEDRAGHRIGVAELRIRRLEGELAAAKGATERAKSEAEAQIENMKAQADARARQHAETERRLAAVQAEVVQSHSIALQARTDAATLVERTRRETAERIAKITSDFDA